MCPQVLTASSGHDDNENGSTTNKEITAYKGRRGRLCGSRTAKPWRIQGGPSIYGGLAGVVQR